MSYINVDGSKKFEFGTGLGSMRLAGRDGVDPSDAATKLTGTTVGANDKFTSSAVKASLGGGTEVEFNNKTGQIKWGGSAIKLGNFANALKDDIAIQDEGGTLKAYNLTKGTWAEIKGGKVEAPTDTAGKTLDFTTGSFSYGGSGALLINNSGAAGALGGAGNDVMINRFAGGSLSGGAGDDRLFNFNAQAASFNGGTGNDALYSIGLKSASIDLSASDDTYVKLLGAMNGGTLNLGTKQNIVDAKALNNVTVTDQGGSAGSTTAIKAAAVKNSTLNLNAGQTAMDATSLVSSSLNLGSGSNSVVINKVSSTVAGKGIKTGAGSINTMELGALNGATIDSKLSADDAIKIKGAAAKSTINLGTGKNSLEGKAFNGTSISAEANSTTSLMAKSITGAKDAVSTIQLGGGNNSISVAQTISNMSINMGTGANTLQGNSMNKVNLTMGGAASAASQALTLKGKASNLNFTGSGGDDIIKIGGGLANGNIDMGAGLNQLTAEKVLANGKTVGQTLSNVNISSAGSLNMSVGKMVSGKDGNSINLSGSAGATTYNQLNMTSISGKGGLDINVTNTNTAGQTTNLVVAGGASNLNYNSGKSAGMDVLSFGGAVNNASFDLGGNDNSITAQKYNAAKNTYTGQNLNNVSVSSAGSLTSINAGNVNKLTYNSAGSGADTLNFTGNVKASTLNLGDGNNSLKAAKVNAAGKTVGMSLIDTNVSAGGNANTTIDIGTFKLGKNGNSLTLGAGDNTLNFASVMGTKKNSMVLDVSGATGTQTLNVAGKANFFSFKGSEGADKVTINGNIMNSTIDLGGGNNVFNSTGAKSVMTNSSVIAGGSAGGTSTINLNKLNTTKGKASTISLGVGGGDINIAKTVTGIGTTNIDLGGSGSSSSTLTVETLGNKASKNITVSGSGSATLNIKTAGKANYDFSAGSGSLTMNIGGTAATGNLTGAKINVGAGGITLNAASMINSNIQSASGGAGKLDLNLSGKLDKSNIGFGAGGADISFKDGVNGSTITADVGAGNLTLAAETINKMTIDSSKSKATNTYSVTNGATALTFSGGSASETLSVGGDITNSKINLGSGNSSLTGTAGMVKGTDITSSGTGSSTVHVGGFDSFVNAAKKKVGNNVTLGAANNSLTAEGKLANTTLKMNGGVSNTLVASGALESSSVSMGSAGGTATNKASFGAGVSKSSVSMNGTSNSAAVTGAVTGSDFSFGGGAASLTINGGSNDMTVDATKISGNTTLNLNGMVSDSVMNMGGASVTVNASNGMTNNEINLNSASATINAGNADITKTKVTGGDGDVTFKGGNFDGSIKLGNGDNNIGFTGSIKGDVGLGTGNNTVGTTTTELNGTLTQGAGGSLNLTLNKLTAQGSVTVGGGTYTAEVKENYGKMDFTKATSGSLAAKFNYAGASISTGSGGDTTVGNNAGVISSQGNLIVGNMSGGTVNANLMASGKSLKIDQLGGGKVNLGAIGTASLTLGGGTGWIGGTAASTADQAILGRISTNTGAPTVAQTGTVTAAMPGWMS